MRQPILWAIAVGLAISLAGYTALATNGSSSPDGYAPQTVEEEDGIPFGPAHEPDFTAGRGPGAGKPDPIEQYGLKHPAAYAGVYVDGEHVVTLWTEHPETHVEEVLQLTGSKVLGKLARFSKRDLEKLRDQVIADRDVLRTRGVKLDMAGIDVRRNRVVLGLGEGTNIPRAKSYVKARYGEGIEVREDY